MTRAAIYARYSSDLQSPTSIEDQIRLCQERVRADGAQIIQSYTDHAISGASLVRPGIQMLLQDAADGKFDVVYAEALDRLSRDQEDIAGVFKRLNFADVKIITISEGVVSELHIGLKGTMNAMYLTDLRQKIRRGLRGKVENGKSAGGLPYGYEVVKTFDSSGELLRGDRQVAPDQAPIVQRIYEEYAAGKSPKAISAQLNKEGVPGPSGKGWTQSTINGNRRRGIGILNNEIYIGVMVWNRMRMIRDPETGKRISRINPEEEWIRKDVPELRIVSDELWHKVKERQRALPSNEEGMWKAKRPKYLLSGLLRCGVCGGGMSMANHDRYGCSTARNKGTCSNKLKIPRSKIENAVIAALQDELMDEELCQVFCEEYARHSNQLRIEKNAKISSLQAELSRLEAGRKRIIEAIKSGVPGADVKDEMIAIGDRRREVEALLETMEEAPVLLHPNMAHRYREEIGQLTQALNREESRSEAAQLMRSLIERIVLTPNEDGTDLNIDLFGDLAGVLTMARKGEKPLDFSDLENLGLKLVAEEGLEPPTRGL
jgi:DNA invertase Pin-like site-specific DNA recombinase